MTTPIAGGFPAVKAAIESTYACLGITCADVGAYSDTTACIDSSNDADPDADAADRDADRRADSYILSAFQDTD